MATTKKPIGQYLKRFRDRFKLKQNKVAESIGVTPQQYLRYEKDLMSPSVAVILNIADTYNVSADYLLGRSDNPQPTNFDENEVKAAFAFRDAWNKLQQVSPQVAAS